MERAEIHQSTSNESNCDQAGRQHLKLSSAPEPCLLGKYQYIHIKHKGLPLRLSAFSLPLNSLMRVKLFECR